MCLMTTKTVLQPRSFRFVREIISFSIIRVRIRLKELGTGFLLALYCSDTLKKGVKVMDTPPLDSLDWSRKFDVVSVSRLVLVSIGFTYDQVRSLTDDDMQAIADSLMEELSQAVNGFTPSLKFLVSLHIAEKGGRRGSQEPTR